MTLRRGSDTPRLEALRTLMFDTIAATLRRRVLSEVGLPISVGAARTKHLAKVASQVAKPDGLVVVEPARERDFLRPLPVELMWGVGPVTRERLAGPLWSGRLPRVTSPLSWRSTSRAWISTSVACPPTPRMIAWWMCIVLLGRA